MIDQCEDYVFYQDASGHGDGSFVDMITPDGIASTDGSSDATLTINDDEYEIVKDYYNDNPSSSTDFIDNFSEDYKNKIQGMFQDRVLEGEEIWYYAVAVVDFIYTNGRAGRTIQFFVDRLPSMERFVNPYYVNFDTGDFAAFGGRNAVYKCLNMVSVDYAARNLQVRMAAQNGRQDTSTYTYSNSWINVAFPYFKSTALLTYNTTRDSGAVDLFDANNRCIDLYNQKYGREATAQSQLTEFFRQITVTTNTGTFYTPATYCLSIVSYVQYDLGANSLMEELQSMI